MIDLTKGQKIDLTKTNPTTKKFRVGIAWKPNPALNGNKFDMDVSVFGLNANDKLASENYFVFYNNKKTADGAITHNGDNQDGLAEGDDETIDIDLSKIGADVTKITFIVTIHKASEFNQNFGQIPDASIKIYNADTNEKIMSYDLNEDYSVETAMEFGKLYLKDGEWKFEAVGVGKKSGLQEYLTQYN